MNTFARLGNCFFVLFSISVHAVPPEACFSNFRWDDCGQPPVPVMYYWKPGSRCEVGMWRGCLPNPNMFPDEYSCINTCIFVQRSDPKNYEELMGRDPSINIEGEVTNTTIEVTNATNVEEDNNSTTTEGVSDDSSTDSTPETSETSNDDAVTTESSAADIVTESNPADIVTESNAADIVTESNAADIITEDTTDDKVV